MSFFIIFWLVFYRRWSDKIVTVCFFLCKNRKRECGCNNETCKNGGQDFFHKNTSFLIIMHFFISAYFYYSRFLILLNFRINILYDEYRNFIQFY